MIRLDSKEEERMKKFFKRVGIVLSARVGFGFICSPCRNLTTGIGENHAISFAQSLQCFFERVF
jgi:hypothetical protein